MPGVNRSTTMVTCQLAAVLAVWACPAWAEPIDVPVQLNQPATITIDPNDLPAGPPGPAPQLSIGTVETLPPGEPGYVTIEGTAPNFTLSFGLPTASVGDDPEPDPTPTACGAATGRFVVAGSKLCGPDGNEFKVKAVNVFPNQRTQSHTDKISCWGFNAVTLAWLDIYTAAEVQAAIDVYTALGKVVIVKYHRIVSGVTPTAAQTVTAANEMGAMAVANKDNPLVWYTATNELMSPSTAITFDANGVPTGWVQSRADTWINHMRAVTAAIRSADNPHPVLISGMLWGMDQMRRRSGTSNYSQMYFGAGYPLGSSLLTFWPQLSAGFDNLVAEAHFYIWHQATAAQMQAYFEAFAAAGIPLYIGEYGEDSTAPAPGSISGVVGVANLVSNWLAGRGIGSSAWAWAHNADSSLPDGRHNLVAAADGGSGPDIDACPATAATNLSPFGAKVLEWLTAP